MKTLKKSYYDRMMIGRNVLINFAHYKDPGDWLNFIKCGGWYSIKRFLDILEVSFNFISILTNVKGFTFYNMIFMIWGFNVIHTFLKLFLKSCLVKN